MSGTYETVLVARTTAGREVQIVVSHDDGVEVTWLPDPASPISLPGTWEGGAQ